MKGKVKRVFPGGNTSVGFYSYYDYIIEEDANRIFVVKGGPGVGKSSLMKNVANELLNNGYDVEFHHCSSDNNSIDGIVIPKLRVAMIDGTAPHIVDPKHPGGVDEIIHLGDYWDLEKMEKNKEDILRITKQVGIFFKRAYKYLKASRPIIEDIIEINSKCMNFGKVNKLTDELIKEILSNTTITENIGKERHLFGSAYTPIGLVDFTDSILQDAMKVYQIKGDSGTGKTTILKKVYEKAIIRGLDVEIYHTPLIPEKIETIYIKDLKLGITISENHKKKDVNIIDLDIFMDNNKRKIDDVLEDKKIANNLINIGIENISKAKQLHDKLEEYYVPNMDFKKVNDLKDLIIERILRYEIN